MKTGPELRQFKLILRRHGNFVTMPRLKLFDILQSNSAVSINQLIELVDSHDQATVYRNILLFEELHIIKRLSLGTNSKIEISDIFRHHHHHLTCLSCGKVIVLKENPTIEKEIKRITAKLDFKPADHQLEIGGKCASCVLKT